ncbi:unnamed protein product [Didymodactylos carnosus]|uniref:Uncharacterized protein n=1 Tax=Didymodactylos carnosus TaxID=1234261 RepID=A0A813ZY25_9BILA|nr:unnamed protein product [Didymodactylos carnosus]CAF3686257.1 unnamed protein product [Didymodactylos carnosus]
MKFFPEADSSHVKVYQSLILSDNPTARNINENNSLSSSSLLSPTSTDSSCESSVGHPVGDYYKIKAKFHLKPHITDESTNLQLQKFKRLLKRLELVYSNTNDDKPVIAANTLPKMSAVTILPPPTMLSDTTKQPVSDRYLFRSSNRKKKGYSYSSTPPTLRKRYKFSKTTNNEQHDTDSQSDHEHTNVYRFRKNGKTTGSSANSLDQRSVSSDRYDFSLDKENIAAAKTLTFVRSGRDLETRSITYIHGKQQQSDNEVKKSTMTTPYLFPPTIEQKNMRHPSHTSSFDERIAPEEVWESKRVQPSNVVFDSKIDSIAGVPSQKRVRIDDQHDSQMVYDQNYKPPMKLHTATTTNGVGDTSKYPNLKRTPVTRVQVVRFDSTAVTSPTSRSYLDEARERLATKRRGQSPQSFNKSLDRFVSTTNQKLKQRRLQQDRQQQRILTPPTQFQHPQSIDPENVTIEALKRRHNIDDYHQRSSILRNGRGGLQQQRPTSTYVSQYYANSDDDQQLQQIYPTPPIDYPIDSDDSASEEYSRPLLTTTSPTTYIRGQVPSAYLAHSKIMKNVNRSLLAKDFINTSTQTLTTSMTAADNNRLKLLDRAVRRQLKNTERQSLQRELNHDLIRCFSSTYIDDLRREEIRYQHTRTNMKSYANEDIEDIYMSSSLENYKMKTAIDREKRIRLGINSSLDPQSSSTPTSSIIGRLSPLSTYSPMMMSSFQDGTQNAGAGDVQSLGFETDRRSQRSVTSTSQTVSNRPPDVDLFYEIVHEHFRGVDATIAGQVSNASQYTSPKKRSVIPQHQQTLSQKPVDVDSDIEINSNSSFWSDEDEQQQQQQMDTDDVPQHHLPQRQINRYLSTVNRSLLDRPSDLISDYYISHLNRSMQDSVRHVETIARNLARNRWRDEFDQLPKLGRSLSAEHLYQVRREHLRYRQPFTTPVSFTAEDVSDIYKPFQLENYKRKIAIEIERRRRERQGQLSTGFRSPMYANEPDLNAVKSYQPVIQVPIIPTDSSNRLPSRTHTVYSTPVTRLQEFDNILDRDDISRNNILIVNPPVVHTKPSSSYSTEEQTIPTQRAKRLLTDDGTDMMHHVEILNSEPIRQSIIKQQHQGILTNRDPQIYHHVKIRPPPEIAQSTLIIDDNRVDNRAHSSIVQSTMHPTPIRERVHTDSARSSVQQPQYEKLTILPQQNTEIRIRQDRAQTKIEEQNNLINGVLKTSQELLIADQEPIMPDRIRRRVNIIPTQQPSPPSLIHQTKIFSHSPIVDKIQISQADVIESSNADDLAMVNIKNVVTINKEEINELNQIAQQAQRLQIEPKDLEHAMIIMDRHRPHQQTHYEQSIHERPFILNAPTVEHFKPHDEEVERYLHQRLIEREQKSHLIIPEAHHMARIEQDIHIFENIEKLHQQQNDRHHLNEIPTHDSGIVSLNTSSSQVSDRPLILNASSQQRLKIDDYLQREYAEQMYDDNYYNRQQFINYTKNDQNENLYRIASQEKLNENIYETVDKLKDNNQLQQSQRLKSQSTEQLQMIRPNEQTTVIYDTTEEFKQDKTAVEEKLKKVYDTLPSKMNLLRPEQTDVPLIYESADFHRKEPVYDIIIKNRQHPPVPPLTTGITQEFYEEIIAEQAPAKNIRETYEAETRSEAEMYERLTHFDRGDGEHEQKTLPKQQEHIELNRAQQGDRSLIYSQGNLHQLDVDELSLMSDTQDEREITQLERELRPKLVQLDQINRVQYYHKPIIGIQPDIRTDTTRNLNEEQLAVREETALLNDHHLDTSIGRQRIIQQQPSQYGHGKQQRMILDDTISLNQDDYQTLKHHASEAFVERNEIQYGDSYGRASLNQVKSFNAPSVICVSQGFRVSLSFLI